MCRFRLCACAKLTRLHRRYRLHKHYRLHRHCRLHKHYRLCACAGCTNIRRLHTHYKLHTHYTVAQILHGCADITACVHVHRLRLQLCSEKVAQAICTAASFLWECVSSLPPCSLPIPLLHTTHMVPEHATS